MHAFWMRVSSARRDPPLQDRGGAYFVDVDLFGILGDNSHNPKFLLLFFSLL